MPRRATRTSTPAWPRSSCSTPTAWSEGASASRPRRTRRCPRAVARPVVTISAAFGTGGSRVAPAVADRPGGAFHGRAITRGVARRLEVPVESAREQEENPPGAVARFLASMVALGGTVTGAGPSAVPDHVADATAYRRHADAALRGFAAEGGVILGRAAAIALAGGPAALHVRLDGA